MSGALSVGTLIDGLCGAHPGLVGLVQGDGAVGARLVSHPGVDMVGMTGSSAVGSKILEAASGSLKRVVLELGGKDPMIVMADA